MLLRENYNNIYKKINWCCVSRYQNLSEDFIREFANELYWDCISVHQVLSESLITDFEFHIRKNELSIIHHQKLSENFLMNTEWIKNYLQDVCVSQVLSEDFIEKFELCELCFDLVLAYQKISKEILLKHSNKITKQLYEKHIEYSDKFDDEICSIIHENITNNTKRNLINLL
jgi:hypothetical protein